MDLHTQLKNAATSAEGIGFPAELITGCRVVDVDVDQATLTLKDGSTRQGDLVIGADGVHVSVAHTASTTTRYANVYKSRTRTKVTKATPFHSGKSAYRFMLKRADVRKIPELAEVVEREDELAFWFDTDR